MSSDLTKLREAVNELPDAVGVGKAWCDGLIIKQSVRDGDWETVLKYARVVSEARRLVDAAEREDGG